MTQNDTEDRPGAARSYKQHDDGDDASAHMFKDVQPGVRAADEQPSAYAQHDEEDTEGHKQAPDKAAYRSHDDEDGSAGPGYARS
jgi:hypothetical protein